MNIEYYGKDFGGKPKNTRIWRYMDLTKFISLISKEELYFPSPEKLTEVDPFDSVLPKRFDLMLKTLDELSTKVKEEYDRDEKRKNEMKDFCEEYIESLYQSDYKRLKKAVDKIRELVGINCWFMNKSESYSMWKLYSDVEYGIAICTTLGKLEESLKVNNVTILIGEVSYNEPKAGNVPFALESDLFYPVFTKRKAYQSENELRIVMSKSEEFDIKEFKDLKFNDVIRSDKYINKLKDKNKGQSINALSVDPKKLIAELYIAPSAPCYFKKVVESILMKYELNGVIVVKKSTLFEEASEEMCKTHTRT